MTNTSITEVNLTFTTGGKFQKTVSHIDHVDSQTVHVHT